MVTVHKPSIGLLRRGLQLGVVSFGKQFFQIAAGPKNIQHNGVVSVFSLNVKKIWIEAGFPSDPVGLGVRSYM